jgi:hypothetical protein
MDNATLLRTEVPSFGRGRTHANYTRINTGAFESRWRRNGADRMPAVYERKFALCDSTTATELSDGLV